MKDTFGTNLTLTLFGESHGPAIGAVLGGLPAGFPIDLDRLNRDMEKRKPRGKTGTARRESDQVQFLSGFFEGRTTGTALTLVIANQNTRSQDYAQLKSRLRPGHADFTAYQKYDGFQDYRGGGHFSGRLTAAITAAGSICAQILESRGVHIASHILQLHTLEDIPFGQEPDLLNEQMEAMNSRNFAVLDEQKALQMEVLIEEAAAQRNSVGGVLESCVTGLPAGIGEPFFDSVESVLSHLLFSIPAVKGVSFGDGFGFAGLTGLQANDFLELAEGQIRMQSNHNGGINGGITNGMPLRIQTCIKPTPSIYLPQPSVDYETRQPVSLEIKGRHDPAIIHRARSVVDAMLAIGILDLWMARDATLAFQRPSLSEVQPC